MEDEELQGIVQNMIDAGESEANIALVVKSYKPTPVKKKDSTKAPSPSTTQTVNTDSVQKDGSLAIGEKPKFELTKEQINQAVNKKPQIGTKQSEETLKKVIQREAESGEFQAKVNQKLANYRQATKVLPKERDEALIELKDVKEQNGLVNNLKAMGGMIGNFFTTGMPGKSDPLTDEKKQAQQFFAEQKIKATPEQIEKKADELFLDKKILSKKQEKINQYLGDLSVDDKIYLKADAQERFSSIPKERKEITDRIALNQDYIIKLAEELKKPMTAEDKSMIESEMDKIAKYLDQDYKAVNKATKELGTAQDELDMFKRNYDAVENVSQRVASSIADVGIGAVSGIDYITQYTNPIGAEVRTMKVQEGIEKATDFVQGKREEFRPDSEEITLENFPQYFTDLLANQSGTLLAIGATGGVGGASILGLGQAGNTYSDMYKENRKSAKYTPAQMAFAPLITGVSTGLLSSLPTAQTLKNAGNVWKSILKTEATKELTEQAVKQTSKNIFAQIGRDMSKEVSTELLDNTIQNAVKKDVLGDKNVGYFDNSWKVIKDTALLTGMLNAGALPQVTMSAVKMFTPSELNKVLDSNGAKIIELSKQLDNINLDDSAKKLVENQISELTKSSTKIIDNTMKKIDGLTEDEVKKVVQYESKKEKLANQAQEVKENPELTDSNKKVILDGLANEYKNVTEKSNEIVNAEIQKPTVAEPIETQPTSAIQKVKQAETEIADETQESRTVINDGNLGIGVEQNADVAITEKPTTEVTETEVVESTVEPKSSEGIAERMTSSVERNIESLINPKTGLSSVVSKIIERSKPYMDSFLKRNEMTIEQYKELSDSEKLKFNEKWRKSQEYKELNESKEAENIPINQPTRKEIRKKAVEVKIDEIANSLKGLESIYGIRIKAQTDGTNTQGTSRDQLIDFIAETAKEIAKTGIEIDEAIRTVITELRKSYDVDIEVDEVKNIAEPKSEEAPATFERKSGKKSLLTRMATGNDAIVKKAVSKYSLNYEIENRDVAKSNAEKFVEEVGIQTALEAVRSGKIVGAEKAYVYATIIDEITNNIAHYNEEEIAQLERLNVEILGEIGKEFDQEGRNAGRFLAALGSIYNGSMGRYNLSKQISDYKALNNGVIPDDILKKFKEADIRIKELEAKLAELQKEKDAQEAEQQFQNIVEAIARKNKLPRNRGVSNTEKAKELANKLRSFKTTSKGSLSASTPISLAYDGAIEVAATILENGGKLADAIKKGIDSIKGQKLDATEESQAVNNFLVAFDNLEPKGRNINIDETGKLKIPHSLIREHVENGIDNIDDLVKAISQDMKEILPEEEFTEREIRDAITQYGKISNPTKDDVEIQIGIMKSLGRLISGLEDAYSGKRPLRSGLQRRAMTLEERQMQRKLKELLRDLPMDDADLTRAWKTALDSIKSRLKNQIADLDKQIADGEKRKAEKKTIEYDEEAKSLRDIRDQKRDLLDELVGKPELSMEEKIEKATILTQNSIDRLQEMIVTGEIDYKTKPTPVTSAKLEALREQRRQLRKQLEEMRADAGLVEMKRLETAKKSRLNRIKELERRIKEKDFSVRTPKPLPIDAELLKIEEQLQEQKAIFEKEKHIFELQNRSKLRKLGTGIVNIIGITRLLKAGGEFSQVLVQQGFLTPEMLVRQPKEFFKAMYRLGKAFVSPDSAKRYEAEMKSNPLYPLMQKTKLSLTGTDHRLDAQEENYQLDLITDTWNKIGEKLGDKKVRTIQGLIKSALGMTLTESDVKSIGQQFKESSPWKMFERGAVSYSNHIKMVKFAQGVKELQKQGKDPINDIEDYKKVAKYVNTFSGRANLGKAEMISKDAALLIFSLRNWYSQIQQLSPVFYSNLGDAKQWKNVKSVSDLKNIKPTVAQKMAVKSFMTSVIAITSFKVAFMAWANAMAGDDEDKWKLETDSRSSDFGKLRKGNKTFDLWHGLNGLVVLYSRILTQQTKSTKTGEVKDLGQGFGTPTTKDLLINYGSNKLAPSAGYIWRLADTKEEVDPSTGKTYRVDPYGNVYGEKEMKDLFVPIYWSSVNEIRKEDPDVYEAFLTSIGILGMSVGTDPKGEKFKDIIGEQGNSERPSRPSAPKRPSRP